MIDLVSCGLRRLFIAGVLPLLAACAAAPISTEQVLTGQEGAVVLRMITLGGNNHPAQTLASLILSREAAPNSNEVEQRVTLVRTRSVTSTTAVFSGMVRPGRYVVQQAEGSSGNMRYTFPMQRLLAAFEVRTGEVTLLGTLVVQPTSGNRFVTGFVPPETEIEEAFEHLFPALAAQTRDKGRYRVPPSPELRPAMQTAAQIKRANEAVTGIWQGPQGGFYAGGQLGKVLWRPAGESGVRSADVGGWREVLALRPYRSGLVAAGEEGLLRYSSNDGRTWTQLPPPDKALLHTVEPLPNGGLLALARKGSDWSAYVSADPMAGGWRRIVTFPEERSLNLPGQGVRTFPLGSRVGVAMPNGSILLIDTDTGTIERGATGRSLLSAAVLPDNTLIAQSATVTRTTLMSTDLGKSWTDLNTSRFVLAIAFRDRNRAYAVGPVAPGLFAGDFALMESRDGARTWSKTGDVPGGDVKSPSVRDLLVDRADGSLVALMSNGRVLRSTNEGKTWTPGL